MPVYCIKHEDIHGIQRRPYTDRVIVRDFYYTPVVKCNKSHKIILSPLLPLQKSLIILITPPSPCLLSYRRYGKRSHCFLQKTCLMSSNEMGPIIQLYHVLATLPLTFSLLRSAIQCIRGARSSIGHALKQPPMDLANSELSFI